MRLEAMVVAILAGTAATTAQQVDISQAPIQQDIALTCTFTTECMDTDGCSDTSYTVTIEGLAGGVTAEQLVVEAELISDVETVTVTGTLTDEIPRLNAFEAAMPQMLVNTPDGARLTAHIASVPLAITYAGTCE
ncbi:MAG: hypothetical protein AAFO80_12445 [Pseudomonadota bacterium]